MGLARPWLTTTSCSACPARPAPTRSRRRTASAPASCTPTPTPATRRAESSSRKSPTAYEVLCDADQRARYDRYGEQGVRRQRWAGPRRHVRRRRPRRPLRGVLRRRRQPVRQGGGRGPAGPPRGQTSRSSPTSRSSRPCSAPDPVTCAPRSRCDDCNGIGRRQGHQARHLQRVQRSRPGAAGAPEPARADGHRRPCRRCGGMGQVITSPCATCSGDGRIVTDKTYQVDVPAGVDSGSTLRLTGRGAAGPRGGSAGDLYVHLRVAAARALRARRPRPRHRRADLDRPGGARHLVHARDARRRRGHRRPRRARSRAGSSCCASGVSRACRDAAAATCACVVRVDVPTKLTDPEAELLHRVRRGPR